MKWKIQNVPSLVKPSNVNRRAVRYTPLGNNSKFSEIELRLHKDEGFVIEAHLKSGHDFEKLSGKLEQISKTLKSDFGGRLPRKISTKSLHPNIKSDRNLFNAFINTLEDFDNIDRDVIENISHATKIELTRKPGIKSLSSLCMEKITSDPDLLVRAMQDGMPEDYRLEIIQEAAKKYIPHQNNSAVERLSNKRARTWENQLGL